MKINTYTEWQWDGEKYVEVANESFDYEGVVSECKGGGSAPSCPPPDTTQPYVYNPTDGEARMMGGLGSLSTGQSPIQYQQAAPTPNAVAPGQVAGQTTPGSVVGGVQYQNPMDMMMTNPQYGADQMISAYDPNNPYTQVQQNQR